MALLLASGSPQRGAILHQLGVPFRTWVPQLRELSGGDPGQTAVTNSRLKAHAGRVHAAPDELVVAVDTIVELDGNVYGKPSGKDDACAMLRTLRGRTHVVVSGLTLCVDCHPHELVARTRVTFRSFTDATLRDYVATGEWEGRAGGYAIQGSGAALVAAIDGDYLNVVGFPIAAFLDLVDRFKLSDRVFADGIVAST